ncbi:MAG: hypothetical protein Q9162_002901 [Coniocarpon cinnabarinum]
MKLSPCTVGLLALAAAFVDAGCPASCTKLQEVMPSCQNKTAVPAQDLCCFSAPGGQILQTQFWDTSPATGPANHWTIHGLWPDHCDGSFDQYCDENRQYTNITQILESYGQTELLAYMKKYWTDYHGQEESFWEHEWGKHGTCMNTIDPACYKNYKGQEEVVDYFRRTVSLFQTLDTYAFLAAAGITPSSTKNYSLEAINTALRKAPGRNGRNATVECSDGQLDEVYYSYNVIGTIAGGVFVPVDATSQDATSCPEEVAYLPKNLSSAYPVSSVSSSAAPSATLNLSPTCRPNGI